jgi:hypothetical protein
MAAESGTIIAVSALFVKTFFLNSAKLTAFYHFPYQIVVTLRRQIVPVRMRFIGAEHPTGRAA